MDVKIDSDLVGHGSAKNIEHKEYENQEQADAIEARENTARGIFDLNNKKTVSGKFENPLVGIPKQKLFEEVSSMEETQTLETRS